MTGSGVYQMVKRRAEEAGYDPKEIWLRQWRDTFANDWLAGGGAEGDLMRLMGWTDRSMLDRYAQDLQVQRAIEAYPGVVRTPIMRSGSFAAGEDAAGVADGFDRLARTNPDQAAEVILRRARQGRVRAVVGPDAHAAALAVWVLGTGYLRLAPLAARLARRRAR